jgi:hypothetical protein
MKIELRKEPFERTRPGEETLETRFQVAVCESPKGEMCKRYNDNGTVTVQGHAVIEHATLIL